MDITAFIASKREDVALLGDYGAYRAQLSRRIATLRKKTGRTSSKGKKFTGSLPTAEEFGNNHELIQLQLLVSERAWAHAMHMRSVHSADTSKDRVQGSDRRHIISRLRKAAKNASALAALLQSEDAAKATELDILEAQAYAESLAGAADFDKGVWPESLRHYSISYMIYNGLEKRTKKDLFKDFRTSEIDPSLRYGAHMVRMPRIVTIPTIARKFFPTEQEDLTKAVESLDPNCLKDEAKTISADVTDLPKHIVWRSRKVALDDVAIATALASVKREAHGLDTFLSSDKGKSSSRKDKAMAYDGVLIPSQDAADAVKQAIDRLAADGVSQADSRMQDLQVTRTAVNYALVGWRIGRNRILDGELFGDAEHAAEPKTSKRDKALEERELSVGRQLARIRERVVLYDSTLQSLDSIKQLPGVAADTKFVAQLEGVYLYFQSFKCLLLAQSHVLLKSLPNALALYARAETLSAKAVSLPLPESIAEVSPAALTLVVDSGSRKNLHEYLSTEVIRHRALVELEAERSKAAKSRSVAPRPLIEDLTVYPASGSVDLDNIVTFPPKLQPVPLKPIFLDLAWNYIEYPGQKKASAAEGAKQTQGDGQVEQPAAKKGWFGFGR